MKISQRAWLLGVVVVLGGCASPADPDVSRRRIGPDGGTISSADSVLTLAIQPGALTETIEFSIEATEIPPQVFGQAYAVEPNVALELDATISVRTALPEDTSMVAVGAVDPVAYASGRGEWMPLPILRVDPEVGLVTGIDTQVSIFYALLDDAVPSDDGTTGDTADVGSTGDGDPGTTDGPGTTTAPGDATDGESTGTTGDGEGSTGSESSGAPAVSFAREIEPIIMANCGCHLEGEPAGLSMLDAYANLVDVPSTEAAGLDRIEPGSPDDSYLWHKVNGTHLDVGGEGSPMPAPDGGLDAGTLATIEAWILDGAQP